jgi:hypothetical protein
MASVRARALVAAVVFGVIVASAQPARAQIIGDGDQPEYCDSHESEIVPMTIQILEPKRDTVYANGSPTPSGSRHPAVVVGPMQIRIKVVDDGPVRGVWLEDSNHEAGIWSYHTAYQDFAHPKIWIVDWWPTQFAGSVRDGVVAVREPGLHVLQAFAVNCADTYYSSRPRSAVVIF